MKILLKNMLTLFLVATGVTSGVAETLIADVTPDQAEKMGVRISSRANGDTGVKVTIEFKALGRLEKFRMTELRMTTAGECLASAPLLTHPSSTDDLSASFSVAPSSLSMCEFWVYVADIPLGGTAFRFKVPEFVDRNGNRQSGNTNTGTQAKHDRPLCREVFVGRPSRGDLLSYSQGAVGNSWLDDKKETRKPGTRRYGEK